MISLGKIEGLQPWNSDFGAPPALSCGPFLLSYLLDLVVGVLQTADESVAPLGVRRPVYMRHQRAPPPHGVDS